MRRVANIPVVEEVYNQYYDSVGNYHYTGTLTGKHIVKINEGTNLFRRNIMNRALTIEYEVFEDLGIKVLTVADSSKDEALNTFNGDEAEELFNRLITVVE